MNRAAFLLAFVLAGCGGDPGTDEPAATDAGSDAAEAGCAEGLAACDRHCVDTSKDDQNCGACGNACPAGTTCAAGSCCPAPTILCGDKCLDPREDDDDCGACGKKCTGGLHCSAGTCTVSNIQHVILIAQENHTFDNYFGKYCRAPAGSNPTCTDGPDCCEAAPAKEPSGASPITLDDSSNFASDPNHSQACEITQINGGKMDRYVSGSSVGSSLCASTCSRKENFALADSGTMSRYWALATGGALADRYFQPIAGGTSANDMYMAIAHFQFVDNTKMPNSIGAGCTDTTGVCVDGEKVLFVRKTIADLLMEAGKTFGTYVDGYAEAKAAGAGKCPSKPSYCPYSSCILHPVACNGCVYDASDNPFAYYDSLVDKPFMKDWNDLKTDLSSGRLPSFSYVKARAFRNEHPNISKISDGVEFVSQTIAMIQASPYADKTLVLLTWDEGGGFYDHVAPPPPIDTDDAGKPVPYGTRVPMLAIGKFARKGKVSHVQMEHSSIVRFLEWNFLGPVGQLGYSDGKVANLGSLLDPTTVGVHVPEN